MGSTFGGLEVAKSGLFAQQSALSTTGHNISNANTEGYTRQRVNFEQAGPYPPSSRNRPEIPGQIGGGVTAGAIERIRDGYLDDQYRAENNKSGYYESRSDALGRLEEVMNEPSEDGLSKTMDRFWDSLQDLSVDPEDSGARSVVRQRGQAVAETFNYLSDKLNGLKGDIGKEADVTTKDINSMASQINSLNQQIAEVEPHGQVPNDLYDERDNLIDKLSEQVNIEVTYENPPSSADAMATGKANITLIGESGEAMEPKLVDGSDNSTNEIQVNYDEDQLAENVTLGDEEFSISEFTSAGKLKGLLDSGGFVNEDGEADGTMENMLMDLDKMATGFAQEFNEVHTGGESLNSIEDGADVPDFFQMDGEKEDGVIKGLAGTLDITDEIKEDTDHIAAAKDPYAGDGDNASALAEVQNQSNELFGEETSLDDYYESLIGSMAVEAQEANRMKGNADTLKESAQEQRDSVSSVSLDEEMTNMIKFQHAYNASARNITTIDELLDRVINQMGVVGR
ncbi:flagellar hook-associated protein FlgK [Halobacillus sp. Marseille-P3879]|uniref:flagellar hook-associated protein FlgK n=1 Tax=Halobacillus sp. Marseille-P3879 TaxID=2045014 RepID=UPI000C79A3DF|nr:flagellar hook-associated protein FlgK [Halobacillus sp. Marseille-P3879]